MPVTTATANKQRQRDVTEKRRAGNRQERDRAHEIGADHERPAAVAVDEAAAEPCEDRAREASARRSGSRDRWRRRPR